jgi:hypothetical protein
MTTALTYARRRTAALLKIARITQELAAPYDELTVIYTEEAAGTGCDGLRPAPGDGGGS